MLELGYTVLGVGVGVVAAVGGLRGFGGDVAVEAAVVVVVDGWVRGEGVQRMGLVGSIWV